MRVGLLAARAADQHELDRALRHLREPQASRQRCVRLREEIAVIGESPRSCAGSSRDRAPREGRSRPAAGLAVEEATDLPPAPDVAAWANVGASVPVVSPSLP